MPGITIDRDVYQVSSIDCEHSARQYQTSDPLDVVGLYSAVLVQLNNAITPY